MFERAVSLVPLLPWFAAGWIGVGVLRGSNRGEQGENRTARVALVSTGISFLLLIILLLEKTLVSLPAGISFGSWFETPGVTIHLSFSLDYLSLSLGSIITLLCWLVMKFSVNYLHREAGFQRFFVIICLFTGSMQLIFLAGNGVFTFAAWELAGVCSYLLIGYSYQRTLATKNAVRALVTNRIGASGFLLANVLTIFWLGDPDWQMITRGVAAMNTFDAGMLGTGFVLAAMVKSAQLPFTPWITRALEGPTPSSAIFYGSVMVHAGVYLLIRIEPVIDKVPALQMVLVVVGISTALYGYIVSLVQSDVKSALILSVVSQVGLMFLWVGMGWYIFAAWHLALHACFRAYQFLLAPAFVQGVEKPPHAPPQWMQRSRRFYTAAMRRFWLDEAEDWLITQPTLQLSRELKRLDEDVITRLVGMPTQTSAIATSKADGITDGYANIEAGIGTGRGVLGRLMEKTAIFLQWFEESLVLRGGGEGMFSTLQRLGKFLQQIDYFLSQPRYLLVLIVVTFVVIL